MSTVEKQRDPRIDALKGVLILLVVLGHCIGHDPSFRMNMTGYNYIYLFHMPLFVFMSGYFTRLGGGRFWNRVLSFIYIYVFWQIAKSLYLGRSLMEMIVKPTPMMWYLLSLVVWCLIYWMSQASKHKLSSKVLIAISLVVALIAGFVPQIGAPFALSRTLIFAPFFFLGVSMQKVNFMEVCNKLPVWAAWGVLIIVCVILYVLNIDISFIVRGVKAYPESNQVLGLCGRMAYYIAAVFMSCTLIRVIAPNKLMSYVGRDTLKYYVFHGAILMIMYNLTIPWSFGYAIVYWVIISVILFFFNKWKVSDFILNPVGKVIEWTAYLNNNKLK